MANFNDFVKEGTRRHRRIKAGYQNIYQDSGNWTGGSVGVGIQAGTNMSISAPKLSDWVGHEVSEQEMRDLSESVALQIYYNDFWLPIRGDEINNQRIANMIADLKSSGGGEANLQRALNTLGYNLAVDSSIGNETLSALNNQIDKSVSELNNAYRKEQIDWYKTRSKCPKFCDVWLGSLDKDYPQMYQSAEKIGVPDHLNNWWVFAGAGVLLIIIIVLVLWMKSKK